MGCILLRLAEVWTCMRILISMRGMIWIVVWVIWLFKIVLMNWHVYFIWLLSCDSIHLHTFLSCQVNVFVYLNNDWPDEYGGHLDLWSRDMKTCYERIAPKLGRFVVFSSTDFSCKFFSDCISNWMYNLDSLIEWNKYRSRPPRTNHSTTRQSSTIYRALLLHKWTSARRMP